MYPVILKIHQILSWLVLLSAIYSLYRSWRGILFKKQWFNADKRAGLFLSLFVDLQVLAGLLLYVVYSPVTRIVFTDMKAAMAEPSVRFYTTEHILMMIVACILIHMGRAKARKAQFAARKHRISAFFFMLATALILLRIPWERIFSLL
jgi:hypothetical protein